MPYGVSYTESPALTAPPGSAMDATFAAVAASGTRSHVAVFHTSNVVHSSFATAAERLYLKMWPPELYANERSAWYS